MVIVLNSTPSIVTVSNLFLFIGSINQILLQNGFWVPSPGTVVRCEVRGSCIDIDILAAAGYQKTAPLSQSSSTELFCALREVSTAPFSYVHVNVWTFADVDRTGCLQCPFWWHPFCVWVQSRSHHSGVCHEQQGIFLFRRSWFHLGSAGPVTSSIQPLWNFLWLLLQEACSEDRYPMVLPYLEAYC